MATNTKVKPSTTATAGKPRGGRRSRDKGKRGEQEALKILRSHFGGLWERRGAGEPGPDLITPVWFPYAVEVKNVSTVKLRHLWHPTAQLFDYTEQAVKQAHDVGKLPLLCIKVESMWFAWTADIKNEPAFLLLDVWCARLI